MGGCKSKDFWPTVKPFLTNKGTQVHNDTILFEDNKLINDHQEVCGIFNHFFVNVAKNIGQNAIPENHPSILKITNTHLACHQCFRISTGAPSTNDA